MAAFTSKATGNWSAGGQTTWNEVGVPGNGDTAAIGAHTVTVDVNTTVGTSPNDATTKVLDKNHTTGKLIVAPDVTLTIKGNLGGVNGAEYEIHGNVIFDASASGGTPVYCIVNGGFCDLTVTKTGAARPSFSAPSGHTFTLAQNYTTFVITECDLTRCAAGIWASTAEITTLSNNLFTACGKITFNHGSTTVTATITGNTHVSSSGTESFQLGYTGAVVSGTRTWTGNIYDKGITYNSLGFSIADNYFGGNFEGVSSSRHVSCAGNIFVTDGDAGSTAGMRFNSSVGVNYFITEGSNGNPHFVDLWAMDADVSIDGSIFEEADTWAADHGDCIFPKANGTKTITLVRNLVLPNSVDGVNGSGCLATIYLTQANRTVLAYHNTVCIRNTLSSGAINVSEGHDGHAGELAGFKSNLIWSSDATGTAVARIQGTVNGIITAAGADYNWRWNGAAGDNGRGYNDVAGNLDLWDGTAATGGDAAAVAVDANGGSGDPQFVDSTRNLAKWCFVRGYGAQTKAAGLAAIQADLTRITDLLTYVKGGFAPTNTALRNAGHDSVTIGAVEGVFPSAFPAPYYQQMRQR